MRRGRRSRAQRRRLAHRHRDGSRPRSALYRRQRGRDTTLRELCTPGVNTLEPSASIDDAVALMGTRRCAGSRSSITATRRDRIARRSRARAGSRFGAGKDQLGTGDRLSRIRAQDCANYTRERAWEIFAPRGTVDARMVAMDRPLWQILIPTSDRCRGSSRGARFRALCVRYGSRAGRGLRVQTAVRSPRRSRSGRAGRGRSACCSRSGAPGRISLLEGFWRSAPADRFRGRGDDDRAVDGSARAVPARVRRRSRS